MRLWLPYYYSRVYYRSLCANLLHFITYHEQGSDITQLHVGAVNCKEPQKTKASSNTIFRYLSNATKWQHVKFIKNYTFISPYFWWAQNAGDINIHEKHWPWKIQVTRIFWVKICVPYFKSKEKDLRHQYYKEKHHNSGKTLNKDVWCGHSYTKPLE